jgi:hypothetical protein
MLKKKFRGHGTVFETKNFRREWIKACVKSGLGEKTGKAWYQYKALSPTISVAPPFATSSTQVWTQLRP